MSYRGLPFTQGWELSNPDYDELLVEVAEFLASNGWITFFGVTFGHSDEDEDTLFTATITGEVCMDEDDWRNRRWVAISKELE